MKRDTRMTIRFDAGVSQQKGRKAAGDDQIEPLSRSKPEMQAVPIWEEAVMPKPNSQVESLEKIETTGAKTGQDPLFQDDIQALEQLIRSENGIEAAHRSRQGSNKGKRRVEDAPEPLESSASSVWSFPEPIKQPKLKVVETERKLNSVPNRIEVDDRAEQPAEEPAADHKPSSTEVHTVVMPAIQSYSSPSQPPSYDGDWGIVDLSATDYKRTYSRGPSWLKVFASVTGAIATGALFGYLALALFAGQGPWANDNEPQSVTEAVENASNPSGAAGEDPAAAPSTNGEKPVAGSGLEQVDPSPASTTSDPTDSSATTGVVQVDLDARSYYALQYGVFSSAEGADAAVAELKDKGLAGHRWDTGNDYRVYVGISGDRDGALALSQQLQGLEVYVKEIELPSVETMPFEGDSKLLQAYWKQTNDLIGVLDRLTNDQLELASPKALDSAVSAAWKRLHEQWLSSSSAVAGKLKDESAKESASRLAQALNTAAVTLAEFDKKPSEAYLWNAQSALMGAVFAEKGWLDAGR